jgi:2,4'-dihydroxyacetophenone dioxygenase
LFFGAPGSGIDRHYHTGSVAGYCLQGSWKYKESDWIARPGTFVYERPGEAHTLQILGDETMVSFFHVMGPHITLDAEGGEIGYVDAFRLLEYCRQYYEENGLNASYLDKITR